MTDPNLIADLREQIRAAGQAVLADPYPDDYRDGMITALALISHTLDRHEQQP